MPDDFTPLTEDQRPQDPLMNGAGWTFTLHEHGGDYPDTMPQAIVATDAEGRWAVYVPMERDGEIVRPGRK